MAINYVNYRNTLDSSGSNLFRQQISNYLSSTFQSLSTAYAGSTNKSSYVNSAKSLYGSDLELINKYITPDKRFSDFSNKIEDFLKITDLTARTTAINNYFGNTAFSASGPQSTTRLDTTGLLDLYNKSGIEGFRKELGSRLSNLFSTNNYSQTLLNQAFTGDARFDINTPKQTLLNLSSDLTSLFGVGVKDSALTGLVTSINKSLGSNTYTQDATKFFINSGETQQDLSKRLQRELNVLSPTADMQQRARAVKDTSALTFRLFSGFKGKPSPLANNDLSTTNLLGLDNVFGNK